MWIFPPYWTYSWTKVVNVDSVVLFWPPGCWRFLWRTSRTVIMICTSTYAPVFWILCFMSAEISSHDLEQLNSNPWHWRDYLAFIQHTVALRGHWGLFQLHCDLSFEKKIKIKQGNCLYEAVEDFLAYLHLYMFRHNPHHYTVYFNIRLNGSEYLSISSLVNPILSILKVFFSRNL